MNQRPDSLDVAPEGEASVVVARVAQHRNGASEREQRDNIKAKKVRNVSGDDARQRQHKQPCLFEPH